MKWVKILRAFLSCVFKKRGKFSGFHNFTEIFANFDKLFVRLYIFLGPQLPSNSSSKAQHSPSLNRSGPTTPTPVVRSGPATPPVQV